MSHKELILEYMKQGNRINKLDAFKRFGCMVLAQRIDDIEKEIDTGLIKGWILRRRSVKEHHNAAEYWLEMENKQMEIF